MKCPVCGNEVPPGSKFCNGCGGQLISEGVSFEEKPEYDEESQTPSSHYDSRLTRYYAAWGVIRGVIGWFMLAIIGLIGGIILVALGWLSRSPGLWLAGFLLVIVGFLAIFPLRVLLRDVYTEEGASLSYDEWKKY